MPAYIIHGILGIKPACIRLLGIKPEDSVPTNRQREVGRVGMRDRRRGREERENIQLTLHLCTRGFQQSERIVEMSGYGCETKGRPQETSTWPVTHLPSFILPSALLFSSSLPPPSPHTRHQGPGDSHYLLARSVIHLCT